MAGQDKQEAKLESLKNNAIKTNYWQKLCVSGPERAAGESPRSQDKKRNFGRERIFMLLLLRIMPINL
jgi:hypothetical protein